MISLDAYLVIIFIWDIDILIMMIDYLVYLTLWLWSCHDCFAHLTCIDLLLYIIWLDVLISLLVYCLDHLWAYCLYHFLSWFLYSCHSLCVVMDDIYVLCMIACCMTTLLLCDCMSFVRVSHISILLPPTLWFLIISFISTLTFISVRPSVCLFLWLS